VTARIETRITDWRNKSATVGDQYRVGEEKHEREVGTESLPLPLGYRSGRWAPRTTGLLDAATLR
jgi:hypothetical protein